MDKRNYDEEVNHEWIRVVNQQIQTFELLSAWATLAQLGKVRDYCRLAIAELRYEIAKCELISLDG